MKMLKYTYELSIEPLTCVHIGSGETFGPLEYVVKETKQGHQLYMKYSIDKVLRRIVSDPQLKTLFNRAESSKDMRELQQFFNKNMKQPDIEYVCNAAKTFLRLYTAKKNGDPLDNALEVQQMYRPSGCKHPVIPGSSFKGAIRTAILNKRMADLDDRMYDTLLEKKGKDAVIQKELLGNYSDAKADPFRMVEIADCRFEAKDTQCVGLLKNIALHKAVEELTGNKIQLIAEVLMGALLKPQVSIIGNTQLRINEALLKEKGVAAEIKKDDIITACNYFYKREFDSEYEKFYEPVSYQAEYTYIEKLRDIIKETVRSDNSFIVRVGHWSQVEFVTYEHNFRKPETPRRKNKQMPYGTTRTVFEYNDAYIPLGWCKCTIK